ncbi:MAG: YqjF family protein [Gemmataceae bacterium]
MSAGRAAVKPGSVRPPVFPEVPMPRPFLTARWSNLFLATYAVPPSLLERRLPPGCALDLRDGRASVSLVAFEFLDTRVLGVGWPGYRNFAELNLRFYVRRGDERGVVFVREFVPRRLVAFLAWWLYNEPYHAAPISAVRQETDGSIAMEYRLRFAGREHVMRVTGSKPAVRPGPDTAEHFFKEHRWGFGVTRDGAALRYEVDHPVWDVYPVTGYEVGLDFASVYGPEWGFLQAQEPHSAVLAAGSAVSVYPKGRA